jgi:hypothetical protein
MACTWPTLAGFLALLLSRPSVRAADPIRTGYTRPGAPSDSRVGGKVVPALDNPQVQ